MRPSRVCSTPTTRAAARAPNGTTTVAAAAAVCAVKRCYATNDNDRGRGSIEITVFLSAGG